eukprot:TRINITY_DN359_c2_g1_i2.p1 TRINITY_DN359_c2_g1~~TRINITY_DN359_c2_g1_i2.p1  ORF type:complete len:278 (-),score=72.29 TRINITY_DN359_c2_g1_i2:36-869(-)
MENTDNYKITSISCYVCSNSKLYRRPNSNILYCKECKKPYEALPSMISKIEGEYDQEDNASSSSSSTKSEKQKESEKRDLISAKIGEKLLLGWTMLEETCINPACKYPSPLMRDPKTKMMTCYGCDTKSMKKDDYDRNPTSSLMQEDKTCKLSVKNNRTNVKQQINNNNYSNNNDNNSKHDSTVTNSLKFRPAVYHSNLVNENNMDSDRNGAQQQVVDNNNTNGSIDNTLSNLYLKMEDTSNLLNQTNIFESDRIRTILSTIQSLSETIKQVEQLKK